MDATASGSAMELAHSDSESDFSHMEDVTPIVKPDNPKGYLSKEVTESVETKAEQFRNINPKLIRGHLLMDQIFRTRSIGFNSQWNFGRKTGITLVVEEMFNFCLFIFEVWVACYLLSHFFQLHSISILPTLF